MASIALGSRNREGLAPSTIAAQIFGVPTTELFTIGYEKRHLQELIEIVRAARITKVVDVRELPLSRVRGFSKSPLGAALHAAGIAYVHLREAGNPYRHG